MPARRKFLFSFFIAWAIFLFWPQKAFAQVVINEFLPNPSEGEDWVELFNSSSQEVDLNGWILDDKGTTTNMLEIKAVIIRAYGFLIFKVGSRLNKESDIIYLLNQQGEAVDEYSYSSNPGTNVSLGRTPDGGEWGVCQEPTPEAENKCILPSPSPEPEPIASEAPEEEASPSPESSPSLSSTTSPIPAKVIGATFLGRTLEASQSTSAGFYPWEATEEAESQEATENAKIQSLPKIIFVLGLILLLSAATHFCYNQK